MPVCVGVGVEIPVVVAPLVVTVVVGEVLPETPTQT